MKENLVRNIATISIATMTLHEEVGRGARSVVYRATRGREEFAVKFYQGTRDLDDAERQFRREAAIHASLRHPAVPMIFEVGIHEGRPYIISEFVCGETLADRLAAGPLSEAETLRIGRTIAAALEVVHSHGLVHRDIKPRNILIAESGDIKLIDFGLAGQNTRCVEGEVVGTFRYSAPEQIGMLERMVDGRADLYALGNVLYECVAGHPPFTTEDITELLHKHAAVRAERLDRVRPDCSPVLVAMIDKLLNKDPDERYQSARALLHDLNEIHQLERSLLEGADLVLGRGDGHYAQRGLFVGRRKELRRLEQALISARGGRGRVVLLEGPAGSGKTRMIEELVQSSMQDTGLMLHGRCAPSDPYPLAPLREALRTHIARIDALGGQDRDLQREHLRRAADEMGGLLQPLGPELARILGASGMVNTALDARELFYNALASFLLNLADVHEGALLWIDDVQWLDDASLEALHRLSASLPERRVLVLLTAQIDDDTRPRIDALRTRLSSTEFSEVSVGPLDAGEACDLIKQELGGSLEEAHARQICGRCQGNPLMIWQYLEAMKDAGVLVPSWGGWRIDTDALARIPLPGDLCTLMTRRLLQLGEATRSVLAVAAHLGPLIEPDQLHFVLGRPGMGDVQQALGEALEAQLIQPAQGTDGFCFVHDRVREALISSPGCDLATLHRRAADFLDARMPLSGRRVFERAHHYRMGYAGDRPERAAMACLEAAGLANADHAYGQAYELTTFIEALGVVDRLEPSIRAGYYRVRGTAAFLTERVGEAIALYQQALALTTDRLERIELRANVAHATIFALNTAEGARELELAFAEVNRPLPSASIKDPAQLQAHLLGLLQQSLARVDAGDEAGGAEGEERGICKAVIRLCETGFLVGYYDRNPLFAMQCGILALVAAHQLGRTTESCQGYATFAFLMGLLGKRDAVRRFGELALNIARELGDQQALATVQSTYALALHLAGDADDALRLQLEVFERYAGWLGPLGYQNCCVDLSFNYFIRGYIEEGLRVSQAAIRRLESRGGPFLAGYVCRASASAMSESAFLGQMSRAVDYYRTVMELRDIVPPDRPVPWISVAGFLVSYYLHQQDFGAELEAAVRQHQAWGIPPERSALHSKHFYVCHAYARLEMLQQTPRDHRETCLEAFRVALRELEATANSPTLRAHLLVHKANLARIEGVDREALALLEEARALAYTHDNPWALFEEARCRARLFRQQGIARGAWLEAMRAHALATQQNWHPLRRRIEAEFQIQAASPASPQEASSSQTRNPVAGVDTTHLQRQLDALIALSRVSASVLDPDALARLALDESARILGAERGYLFTADEAQGRLHFQCGRNALREDLNEPNAYSRTIIERVFETGRALILSTRSDAQALESESVMAFDLRSVLAAPLRAADRVLGVIYLDNRLARGIFNHEHAELLRAMGSHIATALQTARSAQLEAQLQAETERRRLAETLRELNASLTSTLNLNEGLDRLLDALDRELDFERALVVIDGDDGLEPVVIRGFEDRMLPTFYRRAEARERLAGMFDATLLPAQLLPCSEAGSIWLTLPLRSRDAVTGFVFLVRGARQPFGDDDRELGMTLVGHAGIAIENARLFTRVRALAELDGLTGLYNRREFFRRADALFRDASRDTAPMAAIMFDVDHFKGFNDRYGHSTGDEVLRVVARVSADTVRRTDLLARYGGEEFAIVLPNTTGEEALEVGERLRRAVADCRVAVDGFGELSVTISVGVAEWAAGEDPGAMLSRADRALYVSKDRGRNTVSVFSSE